MQICQKINEKGFTLVEIVLVFTILLMIVFILPLVIKLVPTTSSPTQSPHALQVELFFNQLGMEIREAHDISIAGNILYLSKPNETVIAIERYGTLIRRRVNNQGHDVFLRHVSSVSFKAVSHGVVVTIVDTKGTKYERRFSLV